MRLSTKQARFVAAYCGSATEAARAAGYAHPEKQGSRLLKNVEIQKAIQEREAPRQASLVATREDRQGFWTKIMLDPEKPMKDRLRASELLGRSEGDFIERRDHKHSLIGADGKPVNMKISIRFVKPGGGASG